MKRFLAILVAILVLALPAATMADYTQNALCTIELHVKQPNMRVLTDYTDRSFVNFEEGDWFSVKWQDQVEVAAVYWEWWHLPARALVECFNDAGERIYEREYGSVRGYLNEALGVGNGEIEALREKLLTD